MTRCPYCQGGRIAVEPGSSLTYPCPDCRPQDQVETMLLRFDPRDCDDRDACDDPRDREDREGGKFY